MKRVLKIAFVIQRFGEKVQGGAELHCRWLAEKMSEKGHKVEVYTTKALDYIYWKNYFKNDIEYYNNIKINRFKVKKKRNIRKFSSLSNITFYLPHSTKEELKWVKENGPYCPSLINAIKRDRDRFDFFIFYCYRYYQTFFGLEYVKDRAILIPTAEEDPAINLRIFRDFFNKPKGIIYLTPEEKDLIQDISQNYNIPYEIIGTGINIPEFKKNDFLAKYKIKKPFVLYVGRVDKNKGCQTLITYFKHYLEENPEISLELVLIGKPVIDVIEHPKIKLLGPLSDEDKYNALKESEFLIMPSPYESLSIITLEAWALRKAVLVNGKCRVLKGQTIRSNGGLFYHNYAEFSETMKFLLKNKEIREKLGIQGYNYVVKNYNWKLVIEKVENFLYNLK